MHPAFFLDRDGTLNVDHDFVHKPEEWDWIPGVPGKLAELKSAGFKLIVITNQSGIARRRFSLEQVEELHRWVDEDLLRRGISIDGWYIAPWHPDFHEDKDPELLNERKPGTVLFERAAREHQIDLGKSSMAGDKISDLEPALKLGMKPYMVRSRFETKESRKWAAEHDIPLIESIAEIDI